MKIALLCNVRPADADEAFEEFDSPETIAAIARALAGLCLDVEPVEADRDLPAKLATGRYDFAFNIAEGVGRRCREAIPAAVCELMGLPFTGSDAVTLGITLDKWLARRVVSPDVPVAAAALDDDRIEELRFPVIVKPNDEGSSKGIHAGSLARDAAQARERSRSLREEYGCPVLVEEFLPGAEITVGVVGNGRGARVLGMMEIAGEAPFLYSLDVKRDFRRRVRYHVPPRMDTALLASYALNAYRLLGCRDIARLDFRQDAAGTPRFLECNPLPGLNPESSDLVILSRGILPYEQLVQGILREAAVRYGIPLP